jgi:hypothetical protein
MGSASGILLRKRAGKIASFGSKVLENRVLQSSKEGYPLGWAIFSHLALFSFVMDLCRLRYVVGFKFKGKGFQRKAKHV